MGQKILLIDDDTTILNATKNFLEAKGFECQTETVFKEAENTIANERFDLIITDYKDNLNRVDDAGNEILERLKSTRFTPLIIYTGFAGNINQSVKDKQNSFFIIIEKGEGSEKNLLNAINNIIASKEYTIQKEIENELEIALKESFREYFWDIVNNHWSEFENIDQLSLKNVLKRKVLKNLYPQYLEDQSVNPIELYEHPLSEDTQICTGLIIEKDGVHFICINNDCDLVLREKSGVWSCKISKLYFLEIKDYTHLLSVATKEQRRNEENSKLINNNSQHNEGKFFFPKTFFFPGGYVEFDDIVTHPLVLVNNKISLEGIGVAVAKVHSPFLHRFISNFSKFYSRFGTPDINVISQ